MTTLPFNKNNELDYARFNYFGWEMGMENMHGGIFPIIIINCFTAVLPMEQLTDGIDGWLLAHRYKSYFTLAYLPRFLENINLLDF